MADGEPHVRIREAGPDDAPVLQAVELASARAFAGLDMHEVADDEPMTAEELLDFQRDGRAWVAVDDADRPFAFLVFGVVDGCAHIAQVSVHPDRARRGMRRDALR